MPNGLTFNKLRLGLTLATLLATQRNACPQGAFQNLGFENATST